MDRLSSKARRAVVHLPGPGGANARGRWTLCGAWSPVRAVRAFTGAVVRPQIFAVDGRSATCRRCAEARGRQTDGLAPLAEGGPRFFAFGYQR